MRQKIFQFLVSKRELIREEEEKRNRKRRRKKKKKRKKEEPRRYGICNDSSMILYRNYLGMDC